MTGQRVEQVVPDGVCGPGELQNGSVERIELIVVVRNDRLRAVKISRFMIRPEFAVITPAVFVNDITTRQKRLLTSNGRFQ